jgi:hypothetical protein
MKKPILSSNLPIWRCMSTAPSHEECEEITIRDAGMKEYTIRNHYMTCRGERTYLHFGGMGMFGNSILLSLRPIAWRPA